MHRMKHTLVPSCTTPALARLPEEACWPRSVEDVLIELSTVARNIFGALGRATIEALIDGQRDLDVKWTVGIFRLLSSSFP
jgi:hypothetical protein